MPPSDNSKVAKTMMLISDFVTARADANVNRKYKYFSGEEIRITG